ncbi:Ankyrin repeat family protein isoform 1 [Hibiscus syriacus]|uniref:Exocyst subunit Exo70 family protein n=1 Tax=Hibiscus syriacus TaxID=106335 RepID=A0A6A2WNB9_HIBSY|nr:Ankyrin repeat family protein isoform 1 [Hibiscus syriacus]
MQFIRAINELQEVMHLLVSHQVSGPEKLTQAQNLMQIAMKRLQKEFYQILSMNRADLDPESVSTRSSRTSTRISTWDYYDNGSPDDEIRTVGNSISEAENVSSTAMSDLKLIADCMSLPVTLKNVNKMEWDVLDLKIKNWLRAEKISMRKLFNGERILCDHVFASSESIKESYFAEISKEGAMLLFGFPELVAKTKKLPTEKMFSSAVRSLALNSLVGLSESVISLLTDFESKIQKDSSKPIIPGGGLHPLTIYSMNYLTVLADYRNILTDIISAWPPPARSSIPESFLDSPDSDESPAPSISVHIAQLTVVLLCKLDGKVRTSNLLNLLGEDWLAKHEAKVRQYAANYERLAWGKVFDSLPENPTASMTDGETKECFKNFTSSFEDAYIKQSSSVVPDPKLRHKIKVSIGTKLVGVYREFHDTHKSTVGDESRTKLVPRFSPEDVGDYLSNLFFMTINSESSSTSSSGSSCHRRSPLRA